MHNEVIPTRMELMKIKQRIALAKKGYNLLKQKRNALIIEFFKILKKSKDIRTILTEKLKEAYTSLAIAKSFHNSYEIDSVALANANPLYVNIEIKNVMGVKIPNISYKIEEKCYPLKGCSPFSSSSMLEQCLECYTEIVHLSIQLAESEMALKRLVNEIEKTKRRVNSLEYILIPRLEENKKIVSLKLDELERDSFVSLKSIKRTLEKKKA